MLTDIEAKIIQTYRKQLESGVDFHILICGEQLEETVSTRILTARPTTITGISKYLYEFSKKISGLISLSSTHLLEINKYFIQLYDFS